MRATSRPDRVPHDFGTVVIVREFQSVDHLSILWVAVIRRCVTNYGAAGDFVHIAVERAREFFEVLRARVLIGSVLDPQNMRPVDGGAAGELGLAEAARFA